MGKRSTHTMAIASKSSGGTIIQRCSAMERVSRVSVCGRKRGRHRNVTIPNAAICPSSVAISVLTERMRS